MSGESTRVHGHTPDPESVSMVDRGGVTRRQLLQTTVLAVLGGTAIAPVAGPVLTDHPSP